MSSNLQAYGSTGVSQDDAMISARLIHMHIFLSKLQEVIATAAVRMLLEDIGSGAKSVRFDEDLWWTIVDDLKVHLGSRAANMVGDSRQQQEQALVAAETWVEDNISNAGRDTIVAAAIVLYGYAKAQSMIHELRLAV